MVSQLFVFCLYAGEPRKQGYFSLSEPQVDYRYASGSGAIV
jgi:hypothetical protein